MVSNFHHIGVECLGSFITEQAWGDCAKLKEELKLFFVLLKEESETVTSLLRCLNENEVKLPTRYYMHLVKHF